MCPSDIRPIGYVGYIDAGTHHIIECRAQLFDSFSQIENGLFGLFVGIAAAYNITGSIGGCSAGYTDGIADTYCPGVANEWLPLGVRIVTLTRHGSSELFLHLVNGHGFVEAGVPDGVDHNHERIGTGFGMREHRDRGFGVLGLTPDDHG